MYHNFIGLDISKDNFVAALHGQKTTRAFDNTQAGFDSFFEHFQSELGASLVVLETTGGHEMAIITYLSKRGIAIHRASGRQMKHFIRSLGKEAKTDAIDAHGIARYGYERHEKLALFEISSPLECQQIHLSRRQLDLKAMLVQEKNRYQAPHQDAEVKVSCTNVIEVLEKEIEKIDEKLQELIDTIPGQKEKQAVLQQVDGIGAIISRSLLSLLPELGLVSNKQIASLTGLAPHAYESGQMKGYRRTKGGRKEVRAILFMAALTATRSKGRLGEFYRKLINRGKKKMVALTALMRKIIVIANAKLAEFLKINDIKEIENRAFKEV